MNKLKKFLIVNLFFPFVSAASVPFSGIYGGADLGTIQIQLERERSSQIALLGEFDLSLFSDKLKLTDLNVTGGLTLGFSKALKKKILLGVEARLHFENLNVKFDDRFEEVLSPFLINDNYFLKLNKDLAILAKLGTILDQKYLVFAVLGPDWGHFETSTHFNYREGVGAFLLGDIQNKETDCKIGGLLGIGTEYLLSEKSAIGMEYHYIFYNKFNFSNPMSSMLLDNGVIQEGSLISERSRLKLKINRFMMKWNYYFA